MACEQLTFCHKLRVRRAEMDKQGIVFNGKHFPCFGVAMPEALRQKMIACERLNPNLAGAKL